MFLIKLPNWEEGKNAVVEHNSCGELSPEQWHRYLTLQQEASEALFHALALRWRQLEEENAPLRTVLSGKMCSMEEDFYDRLIQQELYGMGREFFEAAAHRVAVREISCRDWWRMVPSADSGNGGQGKTGGNHHPDTGEPGLPKNVKKIWRRKIKAVPDEKSPGQLKKTTLYWIKSEERSGTRVCSSSKVGWAKAIPPIHSAPDSSNARAASSIVEPVVITSSTIRMRLPLTS